MVYYLTAVVAGLVIITVSADRFVIGSVAIARKLGISVLVIGLTIVGFGTSAPEILVSGIASWQGNTGLAFGNALGSNIANMGLILGCTALISPIAFHSRTLRRELPILLGISLACFGLSLKGEMNTIDAILLISCLVGFLVWLVKTAKNIPSRELITEELEHEYSKDLSSVKAVLWFVLGLIGLILSSRLLVWGSVHIAQVMGVSDLVIGLTIVALGTSLPELAASISSVVKGEDDLAVGNVIGSNIYNLLAVYPLPGLFHPGPIDGSVLSRDFPLMIGFTVVVFILGAKSKGHGEINRIGGLFLLTGYGIYQTMIFLTSV